METPKSFIDMKTLIHAGVELVVISGITVWLNKKISNNQDQIQELKDKIAEYEKIILQQNQLLGRHEQIIQYIMNGKSLPAPPPKNQGVSIPNTSKNDNISGHPVNTPRVEKHVRFDDKVSDEELDKHLGSELKTLISSRSEPEYIEIESNVSELKDNIINNNISVNKKKSMPKNLTEK